MQNENKVSIEEFRYPQSGMPASSIWPDLPVVNCDCGPQAVMTASSPPKAPPHIPDDHGDQISARLAEEAHRSFAAGRTQGVEEGRRLEREEQSTRLQEIEKRKIQEIAEFAEQFAHERDTFLHALEQDVVKLCLSIASRILRREAQMDPLFLVGAVRVALGQLAETAAVRLRVPAEDAGLWSETIAHLPGLKVQPAVIGDEGMQLGNCVLETDMGMADIGFESQLAEIARGFFDSASSTSTYQALPAKREKSVSG